MIARRKQEKIPASPVHRIRDKIIAVLVFAAAAAAFYYLTSLPAAVDIRNPKVSPLEAGPNDEIVLIGPEPAARFLSFEGGTSSTVDARFERARLHPDTIAALVALGLQPPADEGEISWITRSGQGSQTFVDVRVDSTPSRDRQVYIVSAGAAGHPNLKLRGVGTGFEIEMGVPLGDAGIDAGSTKQLKVKDFSLVVPGAFPIKVVVPDQARFSFQFGSGGWSFHAGNPNDADSKGAGLALRALGVRPRQTGAAFDEWMCAAPRGSVSWLRRGVHEGDCEAKEALIRVVEFGLEKDKIKLDLAGSADVVRGGAAITGDWYSKLENNKLIAALLGLFYATLARWVWKVFSGGKES